MTRRERQALLLLSAVVLSAVLADETGGLCTGALHLVPFFAVLAPLLFGRFLGEGVLHRFRRARERPKPRVALRRVPRPASWAAPQPRLSRTQFARPPPWLA